jgi:hypothetical protein
VVDQLDYCFGVNEWLTACAVEEEWSPVEASDARRQVLDVFEVMFEPRGQGTTLYLVDLHDKAAPPFVITPTTAERAKEQLAAFHKRHVIIKEAFKVPEDTIAMWPPGRLPMRRTEGDAQ